MGRRVHLRGLCWCHRFQEVIDRLFKEVVNLIILTEPSEGHVGSLLVESRVSDSMCAAFRCFIHLHCANYKTSYLTLTIPCIRHHHNWSTASLKPLRVASHTLCRCLNVWCMRSIGVGTTLWLEGHSLKLQIESNLTIYENLGKHIPPVAPRFLRLCVARMSPSSTQVQWCNTKHCEIHEGIMSEINMAHLKCQ